MFCKSYGGEPVKECQLITLVQTGLHPQEGFVLARAADFAESTTCKSRTDSGLGIKDLCQTRKTEFCSFFKKPWLVKRLSMLVQKNSFGLLSTERYN